MFSFNLIYTKKSLVDKRKIFFEKHIKSSYVDDSDGIRIIFFPKSRGPNLNLNDPVARECNGLIFKLSDNKPKLLVVPPQLLSQYINYKYIYKNWENYNIYKIQDGTSINMYWWESKENPSWRISTAKAYDATGLTWNSGSTYKEIFESILTDKFNILPETFYNKLDKKNVILGVLIIINIIHFGKVNQNLVTKEIFGSFNL